MFQAIFLKKATDIMVCIKPVPFLYNVFSTRLYPGQNLSFSFAEPLYHTLLLKEQTTTSVKKAAIHQEVAQQPQQICLFSMYLSFILRYTLCMISTICSRTSEYRFSGIGIIMPVTMVM